jgi:serine/threonine protein kinase
MESNLQHIDPSAFSSCSVRLINIPSKISAIFTCVVPPKCELNVRKVRQKRKFNLDQWIIDLNEYSSVRMLNKATVEQFKHKSTKSNIAVKVVRFEPFQNSPGDPELQFRREIETLLTLRHPCVVHMLGWCPHADRESAHIVMDYLKISLKTLLHDPTRYPWWTSTAKAKAVVGIVQGMAFAHSRNVMHRDLKTRVILFDSEHEVKIAGFGRSKFDDVEMDQTKFTNWLSLYEAPELWMKDYTNAVDVYSFAMVLFRIVMNRGPFPEMRGKTPLVRMKRVMNGSRAPVDDTVAPLARALIESCWAHEPTERPSFVQIMETLNRGNFMIFDDVDPIEVREFVELIRLKGQLF